MSAVKKEICRLCYYETVDTTDIFSQKGITFDYVTKISRYLYFSVSEDDDLPKTVCWMCTQHLETFHRFYEKINDIQKAQLSKDDYESIVLRPRYDSHEQSPCDDNVDSAPEKETTIDDEGQTYEVLVIADDFDQKTAVDNEFEEFELIEVDNVEANNDIRKSVVRLELDKNDEKEPIQLDHSDETEDLILLENVEKPSEKLPRRRSSRRLKDKDNVEHQTVNQMKREPEVQQEPTEKRAKKIRALKKEPNAKDKCDTENMQQDCDDIEGESDDEFPARDSDNEDWPSQETLSEFPKEIIKKGLLTVKGKELMTLICRFYNLECKSCPEKRRFKHLHELFDHYTNAHNETGYVECCQSKFFRYPAIIMHMARHLQPDAFKCDECGYIVTRPRFLQSHKQTHLPDDQKPYACDKCSRRFCWKSALRIHMISHKPASERRQYVCHVCGRIYDTPGGLSTHKKLAHSETKPVQSNVCHICAKNFSTRTGLHEHMVTIHQPREKGQMQCTECGKWLMNLRCLKTHMVLHSNVELRCDKCDYVTKKKVLLNRHMLTQHSTDRPYVCNLCGRDFKMKRALTVHVAQHGSTTKYKCPFCTRTFNSSTNFYTHRKNSHPKELAEMKHKEEEERRRKRIAAGVEEEPEQVNHETDQRHETQEIQRIKVQIADNNEDDDDDDDDESTFHVTEIRDTHLILKTNTGEEYTVLEVKSPDKPF